VFQDGVVAVLSDVAVFHEGAGAGADHGSDAGDGGGIGTTKWILLLGY
jgi:hypothetical protein